MKNPCFGCEEPKRHLGCHDRCPERAEWIRLREIAKENRNAARQTDMEYRDFKDEVSKRNRRRRK